MKIKAVIIDDEYDARFNLKHLISRKLSESIEIISEADGVNTGLDAIQKYNPDLIFLDISMRDGTGFDLLNKIETINFETIFITAYDKFAAQAIEFSAFAYLMKPVNSEKLKSAIDNLTLKRSKLQDLLRKRIKILIENYGDEKKITKLVVANIDGFDVLTIEEIIRLEGDGNYTNFILTKGRKVISTKSIGVYEELLKDLGYFRIHQSFLINLRHIAGYIKADNGQVKMSDGKTLKISRHRKKDFFDRFLK